MSYRFPSDEWIKEISRQLNESASYEGSAKDWEGDFVFVIEPEGGMAETAYLFLGLLHGKSPDAALVGSANERPPSTPSARRTASGARSSTVNSIRFRA